MELTSKRPKKRTDLQWGLDGALMQRDILRKGGGIFTVHSK